MNTAVYNNSGKEKGTIELPKAFEAKVSRSLLHEVVLGYLSNQREGSHSTKTRGEVSGGGAKPWKQKGTGNARAGSNRSPLWRKGGIIFGPRPKDYYTRVSQTKRNLSLQMALTLKLQSGDLMVLDSLKLEEAKTKRVAEILKKLKIEGKKILLVVDKADEKLRIASRNIPDFKVCEQKNINTFEVMRADKVVFTESAIEELKKNS